MRVFEEWRQSRADDACPSDIIEAGSPDALNHCIPRFINEAQRRWKALSTEDNSPASCGNSVLYDLERSH